MIAAGIVLFVAAAIIAGAKPLVAALDKWAARRVESLVEPVLGPEVDWTAADEWWAAQGRSQTR